MLLLGVIRLNIQYVSDKHVVFQILSIGHPLNVRDLLVRGGLQRHANILKYGPNILELLLIDNVKW